MLNKFDAKDRALSTKQEKQQQDKKEVVTAIAACKAKLAAEQAEAEVYSSCLQTHGTALLRLCVCVLCFFAHPGIVALDIIAFLLFMLYHVRKCAPEVYG